MSVPHPSFDNKLSWPQGSVCTYYGQYWQATRDVSPPMFPSIQSGDVPGDSDAWRSMSADEVVNTVLGELGPREYAWGESLNLLGCDEIGDDPVVLIPTVGATYTDAKTVAAVQQALVNKGYDLGTSGPSNNGVDGVFGPKTKAAIEKLQKLLGNPVTGKIDVTVITALQVTPGVLPPGVTIQGRAALQAAVVLDAATAAEHSTTSADISAAADAVESVADAAAPPPPPEVKQAVQKAVAQAKAATTPAQVQAAAVVVQQAAQDVHKAVAPSWWKSPAWQGGLPRWEVATIGGGVFTVLGMTLVSLISNRAIGARR